MNKKIDKYESSERIDTDSALLGSDAKYTFKVLSDKTIQTTTSSGSTQTAE